MEPDGDAGPPKKSECDAGTFKVPYPYKNPGNKLPLQPTARRAATLYQPWTQSHTSTGRTKAQSLPQHSWAGWAEFHHHLHTGGSSDLPHPHGPSVGHIRDYCPAFVQPGGLLRYPLKLVPVTVPEDGERPVMGYRREAPKLRERFSLETFSGRTTPRGDRGPWGRRREPPAGPPHSGVGPTTLTPSFLTPSLPPVEDVKPHEELLYEHLVASGVNHPRAIPSLVSSSSPSSASSPCSSSGYSSQHKFPSFQAERKPIFESSSAPASSSSSPPPSPEPFPWLLPHFAAGSLIELRDGRLKRVEDLQTEDFLLGSLARRGLQLSCCTVQSITSSSSSSSSSSPPALSRLLILLHDQNSQELVDVYMEYPFFVRGRGWSSCCPERTARLCGLSCGQLSVGDVCLALTPASPSGPPDPGEVAARRCMPKEQTRSEACPPAHGPDPEEGAVEGE
ncbi:uncharacterized protein LOC115557856 [Gadus morhua]|uniref:Uncharacterized LOC115557856 n=1 Tax=Gadus morhua TaxID=8049 RepID=A0A8C5CLX1_GADMO|nr:uncharacterized protein LOC115557856 [Gadus morhua]